MTTHKKISLKLIDFCFLNTQQDSFKVSKTSAIDGYWDKKVHSELFCGGYFIADDEVSPPLVEYSPGIPLGIPREQKNCPVWTG